MATSITDLPLLLRGFPPGNWVAISTHDNLVLSSGIDAVAVADEAEALGDEHPLMVKVPSEELTWCLSQE